MEPVRNLGRVWLNSYDDPLFLTDLGGAMSEDVHAHIEELVAEEHRLWELEASGNSGEAERRRLAGIKVELDRYWDLLRRRRAAGAVGVNENNVNLRSEETVESYLQ